MDSLPESELNVPIQINLKPLYQLAEKNIETNYTSPNWPDDWVTIDCANRYKYQFRRSPLQFTSSGKALNIGFTGYYRIIGSTRACLAGAVITPWSPPCRCGFDEGERRVKVSFANSLNILNDYKISLSIKREEPAPIDKCNVCFIGVDITNQVMTGLKEELDLATKAMIDSFGVIDLKPQVQQVWNKLNTSYNLYGLGWLKINPEKIRLNDLFSRNDTMNINLGLTAKPIISFEKEKDYLTVLPDIDKSISKPGFNIFLDAVLNYDSLSNIMNTQLKGTQIDLSKGKAKKVVIIKDCRIYGSDNEKLIIKMSFGGTKQGIVYFTGKPFYDEKKKMIEVRDVDFDVKTKNLLIKTADWLFNRKITSEIAKVSKFDLSSYIDNAITIINQQLNIEWINGVKGNGNINELKIIGFYPLSNHLIIRNNASGILNINVDALKLDF